MRAFTPRAADAVGAANVYLTIRNLGSTPDELIAVRSPVSRHVVLDQAQRRRRPASRRQALPSPPRHAYPEPACRRRGARGPRAVREQQTVPLTLVFRHAGQVTIDAPVTAPAPPKTVGKRGTFRRAERTSTTWRRVGRERSGPRARHELGAEPDRPDSERRSGPRCCTRGSSRRDLRPAALLWGRPAPGCPPRAGTRRRARRRPGGPPSRGRRLLRIGFGLLWMFDGILQAQPAMAAGLPSQVIEPTAANSPAWVQHLVNWGGTIWSYHPVQAGASAVWIQVGIGLWLLAAARGRWSRPAGLASVGLGAGGVGVRRVVRRHLRPRPDLAVRRARRGAVLLRGRGAHRAARAGLADARGSAGRPGRDGVVLRRHGGAPGLAGPRLLAGHPAASRAP